jgi:hypothetical protein
VSEAGSGIEGLRKDSGFARLVAENLESEDFKLVDVGCAGGLPSGWRAFGERLAAIGFDGNAAEVARLQDAESNPKVSYVAGWVGLPDDHPLREQIGVKAYWHDWPDKRLAYERQLYLRQVRAEGGNALSLDDYFEKVVLAQEWSVKPVHGYDLDYARSAKVFPVAEAEAQAALAAARQAERPLIHLPAYLKGAGFEDADFLKIDIDGPDFEVLRSATSVLDNPGLLGAALEVCFYGSHDANDNTFHNTDRLMRQKGFELFGLSVRAYSSAALPWPYLDEHPSMSIGGRPMQGDAIYIRDLASRGRADEAAALSDDKLAKAAALLALFTLPDQAAEMLMVHRARLSRLFDIEQALNLLAQEIQEDLAPPARDYREFIGEFEAEDPRHFNMYGHRSAWMKTLIDASIEAPQLRRSVEEAQLQHTAQLTDRDARIAELTRQLAELQEGHLRAAKAEASVEQIRKSTSWRITAPLRWLSGRRG